jgi:hypothetical protein
MPQIDQCEGHQFHPVMPLLFELKVQQQPIELILPREECLPVPQGKTDPIQAATALAWGDRGIVATAAMR